MDADEGNLCISMHNLKPLCDNVVINPTKQNVTQLKQFLSEIPSNVLQMYQSYILFPIELQLYQVSNTEIQRHLVDCLALLIKLTHITSVEKLIQLSGLLCQKISSGKERVTLTTVPEELKLSVVQCIKFLFTIADSSVLYEFYDRKFYPQLSALIFICTLVAKEEKLVNLRVAALQCILTLANVSDTGNFGDAPLREKVRNIIMLVLPGIVNTCVSIANDSDLQNHNISVANLRVWSEVIALVMEDDTRDVGPLDLTSILEKIKLSADLHKSDLQMMKTKTSFTNLKEKIENMKNLKRTEEWLSESAQKLTAFTLEMTKYQSHRHYATRRQLSISCKLILDKCSRNMALSVSNLVSTLIILSQDEMLEVSEVAVEGMKCFASLCEQESGKSLFEVLEEDFYALLSSMPITMQEKDAKCQLSCLSLLEGYLKLQDKKLPQVLSSRSVLNRLVMSLVLSVTIDSSGVILLEEYSIKDVEAYSPQNSLLEPWKTLKYCNDKLMLQKLNSICKTLSNVGNLVHLVHALLDALDEIPQHSKEITFILNMILTSGTPNSMEMHHELINTVIETYLEPRLWNLPISVTQGTEVADNILQAKSNVIQVCLLVEGIGKFALVLGGPAFSSCLLSCLYPTLERAGSPLSFIATAGLGALQNISKACVNGRVIDLIQSNVDYLSHHITVRLKQPKNTSVLTVLSVVIKHSTADVLPLLHNIIRDVFVQSCEMFQEQSESAYLQVFHTFMVCVNSWHRNELKSSTQSIQEPLNVVQKLLEYKRLKVEANQFDDIDENKTAEEMYNEDELKREATEYEEDEMIDEEPTKLPPHIELTVDILNHALHFLPSKDETRQLLVLQILREGVIILSTYENQLLPVVHKIWSPLVNRFQSSLTKPLIMQYAFLLLCVLASAAKGFIRSRTLKSVLPRLYDVLHQSVNQSRLKDSGSIYRHTQLYKLQLHLLNNLGQLAVDIGFQEHDLYLILTAASPYLSVQQPVPLQEASKLLFKHISDINQDMVWLHLQTLWSSLEFSNSDSHQQLINPSYSTEFKKNVTELYDLLH